MMRLVVRCVLSGALALASGSFAQPLASQPEVQLLLRLPSEEANPMVERLQALLVHVPVRLRRTGASTAPSPEILTIEIGPVDGDRVVVRFRGPGLQGLRRVQLRSDGIDEAAREVLATIVASAVRAHVQDSHANATRAPSLPFAQPIARRAIQPVPAMPPASRQRPGAADTSTTIKRESVAGTSVSTTTTMPVAHAEAHSGALVAARGTASGAAVLPNHEPASTSRTSAAKGHARREPPPSTGTGSLEVTAGYEVAQWAAGALAHGPRASMDYGIYSAIGRWGGRLEGTFWWQTRLSGPFTADLRFASLRLLGFLIPAMWRGERWTLEMAAGIAGTHTSLHPRELPGSVSGTTAAPVFGLGSRAQVAVHCRVGALRLGVGASLEADLIAPAFGVSTETGFRSTHRPWRVRPGAWLAIGWPL